MKEIKTNDGKKGGWLVGKRHYDKSGKSLGGIKAIVTDAGGKPVELEGGEVIINREASKKYWKELSKINQSAGNGVAIGPPSGFDEDPEDNYENGGKIDFNPNHIPNKWILSYAEKIKANHPEIWKLGGNIFGNEAFNNLKRVADRGHWLDSEEWMYIKWRAYVARHIHDFRIEGVVAMLKWVDKVEKGWPYMKQLIEEKIKKIESKKKGWKHKTTKMKTGGIANDSDSLTVTKYILNRHPKKDDIFQGGKVDGYKIIKIKKLKKDFGIVYHILILNTKKNAGGKFNKRIISYRPESKKITDFLESNLTATKGTYYTQWDDSELQSKMKTGGSVAQTSAPKKDQIKGSDVNKSGSSATTKSASSIKFDEKTIESINNKVKEHNQKHPNKKITLASAKAVVRRGMGAYSSSHRPTITGGKPNSRTAWGIARLNAFTYKIVHGKSKSGKYTQDDDLIEELGYSVAKYHLGGDMSKHLAPNGKPSNLTHEQWHLVRTPAFKAWFGDWENDSENASKVVDENGEPLVVYHGTYVENPFYIFDFDKADLGFHFGTYEQAKNRSETKLFFKGRKSIVNSFFLNIKTIFESSDIGEWEYPQRYIDMFVSDALISESDAKKNGFYRLIQREENKQIREYLLNKYGKFVGFVYNNKYEGKGKSFIVLNPNQIKLADGSNTTFDGSNPDIRFDEGGLIAPNGKPSNLNAEQYKLVRTKAFKDWFGDWENSPQTSSKIVDSNGEPKVMYRGNKKLQKELGYTFNLGRNFLNKQSPNNFGFFFTDDIDVAKKYGGRITEVFLKAKNIFDYSDLGLYIIPETFISYLGNNFSFNGYKDLKKKIIEFDYDNQSGFFNNPYDYLDLFPELRNLFNDKGFDSVSFQENSRSYFPYMTYAVFEPNQIKLADGTNTTFDGSNPDIRFERGGQTEKQHGDCYVVAGKIAMGSKKIDFIGTPYLVHAQVEGQGTIKGIKYGHAWVEDDIFVYDYSNGRELVVPKKLYYAMGNIKQIKPQYYKYTFNDAMTKMIETQHYGSWDLQTESGL